MHVEEKTMKRKAIDLLSGWRPNLNNRPVAIFSRAYHKMHCEDTSIVIIHTVISQW